MKNSTLILFIVLMTILAIFILLTIGIIIMFVKGVECIDSPISCLFKTIF